MLFEKQIVLKNGSTCILKTPEISDAEEVLRSFLQTHSETEYLASYPDESTTTIEEERTFIEYKNTSPNAAEICAYIDGHIVGMAGIEPIGKQIKMKHRASFGISIEKAFWGLGIGKALTKACIECARSAGFVQLELEVVSDNTVAIKLYEKFEFIEYGRNPLGFRTRDGRWQELVLMRIELEK